jgi:hypothetical protein
MATKHTISRASEVFIGAGYDATLYGINGRPGAPIHILTKVDLGAPAVADPDLIVDDATSTELPNNTTITYTTADDGTTPFDNGDTPVVSSINTSTGTTASVWKLDVPRNLVCVVTHDSAIVAMTTVIAGYDVYGVRMTESFVATATGTTKTVTGAKAFAAIESIAITSAGNATTNTLTVGSGSLIGLPYKLASKDDLVSLKFDGATNAPSAVVAAVTTTASATTGDIRGTVAIDTVGNLNGAKTLKAWMYVADPNTAEGLRGVAQA